MFQRTDTSKARADCEKEIQLAEHALEILQRYVPEHKGMLSSLEGKKLVDLESCRRMEAARETVLHKARKIEELSRKRRNARPRAGSWKMRGRPWSPGRPWRFPWILRGRSGRRPSSGHFRELCPRSSSAKWWRRLWRGTPEREPQTSRQLPGRRSTPAITPRWCPQTPTRACVFILVKKEDAGRLEEALRTEGFARPSRTEGTRPAARQEELTKELAALKEKKEALEEQIRAFAESREELKLAADYYRMRLEKYELLGSLLQSRRPSW